MSLEAPGVVGALEGLGVVGVQVTHKDGTRSSTPSRDSPRGRRPSARGPSRPAGCMLLRLGHKSLRRAGIGQRATMGSDLRFKVPRTRPRSEGLPVTLLCNGRSGTFHAYTPAARGHHSLPLPQEEGRPHGPGGSLLAPCVNYLVAVQMFVAELKELTSGESTAGAQKSN